MAVSPAGAGVAYVFSEDGVHVSADAGRTWQAVTGTLQGAEILAAAVNPYVPTEVYASFADAGLQRSRDGGRTWEAVATPDNEAIVAIYVGGIPPLLFIAVESGRVQASSDEGETWAAASGAVLASDSLDVDVSGSFGTFFSGNQSAASGGKFTATVGFNVDEGAFEDIQGVSVTATNFLGTSNSVSLNLN